MQDAGMYTHSTGMYTRIMRYLLDEIDRKYPCVYIRCELLNIGFNSVAFPGIYVQCSNHLNDYVVSDQTKNPLLNHGDKYVKVYEFEIPQPIQCEKYVASTTMHSQNRFHCGYHCSSSLKD